MLSQEPPSPRQWEGAGWQGEEGVTLPLRFLPGRDSESRHKYEKAGEDELEMEEGLMTPPKKGKLDLEISRTETLLFLESLENVTPVF